jgi:hypothetical protein
MVRLNQRKDRKMKPPKTMPLPWVIASVADERCRTCVCIFDKDGLRFNGIAAIDQGDAAAYIQHCVNNYPALVEALKFDANIENFCITRDLGITECEPPHDYSMSGASRIGKTAQEVLRKAGE